MAPKGGGVGALTRYVEAPCKTCYDPPLAMLLASIKLNMLFDKG